MINTRDCLGQKRIVVLLVEDSKSHESLLARLTTPVDGFSFSVLHSTRVDEIPAYMKDSDIDAIVVGLQHSDRTALRSFEQAKSFAGEIPLIGVVSKGADILVAELIRHGAEDCLANEEASPALLARTICHAVARRRLQQALDDRFRGSDFRWSSQVERLSASDGSRSASQRLPGNSLGD